MRIISNFYDFYDSFNDNESLIIYKRVTSEDEKPKEELFKVNTEITKPFSKNWKKMNHTPDFIESYYGGSPCKDVRIIYTLIANKLYKQLSFTLNKNGIVQFYNISSHDELFKVIDKHEDILSRYIKKMYLMNEIRNEIIAFFNSTMDEKIATNLHLYYNAPIIQWISRGKLKDDVSKVQINPSLKKSELHKVLNPFNIFQDISQFIDNYLVKERETPIAISDLDKIQQHGFDKKTSFRNM